MQKSRISIHALREEGDGTNRKNAKIPNYFYPRPPRGGRQAVVTALRKLEAISIHALREESDLEER